MNTQIRWQLPRGGMKEMKELKDQTGIIKKLAELGLPQGKSNNSIGARPCWGISFKANCVSQEPP